VTGQDVHSVRNRTWTARLEYYFTGIESAFAIFGLALMLGLSLIEIVLRNFFHYSIPGADILIRHLVLWVSFLGAVMAVRERHIKVEIIAAWMPEIWHRHLERPIFLFSAVVCAVIAWAAVRFWYQEWLHVPAGERWIAILGIVIPLSFFLLALHFTLRFLIGPRSPERTA
jgi:TRAP-type C4-dicarboxylate transport system permease small subunit